MAPLLFHWLYQYTSSACKTLLLHPTVIVLAGFVIGCGFDKVRPFYISVSVGHRCEVLIDHESLSVAVNNMKVETLDQ